MILLPVAITASFGGLVLSANWPSIPDNILPSQDGSLVATQLGLPSKGHVVAFGHFSSDRLLDCLVLGEDRSTVTIYVMNHNEGRYTKSHAEAKCPSGKSVVEAIMSDFNHDGYADVLLGCASGSVGEGSTELVMFIGDGDSLTNAHWSINAALGQVAAIDFTGTMQLSLVGRVASASDKDPGASSRLAVWRNKASSADEVSTGYDEPSSINEFGKLPNKPVISQADFNGDGLADLLFTYGDSGVVEGVEIWTRVRHSDAPVPYELGKRMKLPPGTGPISIADVDGDGHLDLIFAVCHPSPTCATENSLHIMYNIQRRYCSAHRKNVDEQSKCRTVEEQLFAEHGEEFNFDPLPDTKHHVKIPLNRLFPSEDIRVLFEDPVRSLPISMNIGDYDLDSYPDIAMVVGSRSYPHDVEYARAIILRNTPCSLERFCTAAQIAEERRSFEVVIKTVEAVTSIRRVVNVAFADWYDLGPPGVLVNFYEDKSPHLITIRNGISRDVFSLRAETLNGVCPAPCHGVDTKSKAERPLSVNYIGASYRFSFVDEVGITQVRSSTQFSQTINGALQSPTTLFGLGRTSNFVQSIEVGVALRVGPALFLQTNLFPNSEIIFWPPHANSHGAWRAELQIHPSDYLGYVIISVTIAIVVLSIVTGLCKWQERREDDVEKKMPLI